MKNIIIAVLSPFQKKDIRYNNFTDVTGEFSALTSQTNESSFKYLIWKLEKEKQKLEAAFLFITPDALDNNDYNTFKSLFPELYMDYVILPKGLIGDALLKIPEMHEKLLQYKQNIKDDIRISVDITGGFRHASMMMLPLIQLLNYDEFLIGEILYANFSVEPKVIEDASSLVKFTSLIGGAEEFISFGSIYQIKNYFKGNKLSERLEKLLAKMTELSETLQVCGSYEITIQALTDLKKAIDDYESSNSKNLNPSEMYFNKLLPKIKSEYGEILPSKNKKDMPTKIIKWCLKKGLLQQAITFYTEWLPKYLIESKKISVNNLSIIEECEKNGKLWSHWSIYFLRNYLPVLEIKESSNITYGQLIALFQTGDFYGSMNAARKINPKLEEFFMNVEAFANNKYSNIYKISKNNLIYKVIDNAKGNDTWEDFVCKRLLKEVDIKRIIVKSLANLTKEKFYLFFSDENNTKIENKRENRREVFKNLLKKKYISTSLTNENLLNFVERYEMFVNELRNKFAHASANSETIEGKADIISAIDESLDYLK